MTSAQAAYKDGPNDPERTPLRTLLGPDRLKCPVQPWREGRSDDRAPVAVYPLTRRAIVAQGVILELRVSFRQPSCLPIPSRPSGPTRRLTPAAALRARISGGSSTLSTCYASGTAGDR